MHAARIRTAAAWLPALAYTLLIWWLSSQALDIDFLDRVPFRDKGVHFLEYGALGFFLAHAVITTWSGRGLAGYLVALLMTITLGLLDELHQGFVPGRSSDVLDLAADSLGAFAAALLYAGAHKAYRALRQPATAATDTAQLVEPERTSQS